MSQLNIENIPPTSAAARGSENPAKTKSSLVAAATGGVARSGKKLQTLQPSAKNQQLLVGADGLVRLGSSGKKKEIKIYEDPTPAHTSTPEQKKKNEHKKVQASVASVSAGTQVEDKDTAQYRAEVEMYGAEEDLPLEYWKDLAEKRREALEVSLTENESLHTSLSLLEEEYERTKEEAESYKSLAEQAQELANILNSIASDNEEDGDSEAADKTDESAADKSAEAADKSTEAADKSTEAADKSAESDEAASSIDEEKKEAK
eukprot:TRINITY_DN7263_c0_g1_i10.p1 TRINITY_DN7263_c0_g1~~TRINITY_DN7263_c0_g1_i10.p1  ORF type:complete len:262 (-),score=121.46 TRINITY_DN7263_c0_g1_i10:545-1330(-)